MRLFITGLMVMLSLTSLAADTVVIYKSDTATVIKKASISLRNGANALDTSSTFKEIYSDLKGGINALASSLKVGTEHVYKILVQQQVVNSITWLLIALIFLGIPQLYRKPLWRKASQESSQETDEVMFALFYCAPILIGFIIFLFNIGDIITGFVNPEYGAIHDIIKMVSNLRS